MGCVLKSDKVLQKCWKSFAKVLEVLPMHKKSAPKSGRSNTKKTYDKNITQ